MHPCGATSITGEQAVDDVLESRLMPRFVHAHTFPLDPPAHVLAEVDAAWERAQELFAGELELHFNVARLSGRVTGELRAAGGDTRRLPGGGARAARPAPLAGAGADARPG